LLQKCRRNNIALKMRPMYGDERLLLAVHQYAVQKATAQQRSLKSAM
jgi:signal-transduction protein with cAMP-binding, CBS, and nucleotidyltransferase domain